MQGVAKWVTVAIFDKKNTVNVVPSFIVVLQIRVCEFAKCIFKFIIISHSYSIKKFTMHFYEEDWQPALQFRYVLAQFTAPAQNLTFVKKTCL